LQHTHIGFISKNIPPADDYVLCVRGTLASGNAATVACGPRFTIEPQTLGPAALNIAWTGGVTQPPTAWAPAFRAGEYLSVAWQQTGYIPFVSVSYLPSDSSGAEVRIFDSVASTRGFNAVSWRIPRIGTSMNGYVIVVRGLTVQYAEFVAVSAPWSYVVPAGCPLDCDLITRRPCDWDPVAGGVVVVAGAVPSDECGVCIDGYVGSPSGVDDCQPACPLDCAALQREQCTEPNVCGNCVAGLSPFGDATDNGGALPVCVPATVPSFDLISISNVRAYDLQVQVELSAPGTAYVMVLAAGSPAPSSEQVIDGLDATGATVPANRFVVPGRFTFTGTKLKAVVVRSHLLVTHMYCSFL
jgi:hypothetical protein